MIKLIASVGVSREILILEFDLSKTEVSSESLFRIYLSYYHFYLTTFNTKPSIPFQMWKQVAVYIAALRIIRYTRKYTFTHIHILSFTLHLYKEKDTVP